jgi:hypothetical protein
MSNDIFEVPRDAVRAIVKEAYNLSVPQGLGFLHYQAGTLDDAVIDDLINDDGTVRIDYLAGRAVKLNIHKDKKDGKLYLPERWFDHTEEQLYKLLDIAMEYK